MNLPVQGSADLFAHIVALAGGRAVVEDTEPARTDDGEKHVALAQRFLQLPVEPLPRQQIVDVHEDCAIAECLREITVQAGRGNLRILTPVAQEDLLRYAELPAIKA